MQRNFILDEAKLESEDDKLIESLYTIPKYSTQFESTVYSLFTVNR